MSTDRVGGSGIVRRHKASHATGGTDALTPADIGAASAATLTTVQTNVDDAQILTLMGAWA